MFPDKNILEKFDINLTFVSYFLKYFLCYIKTIN